MSRADSPQSPTRHGTRRGAKSKSKNQGRKARSVQYKCKKLVAIISSHAVLISGTVPNEGLGGALEFDGRPTREELVDALDLFDEVPPGRKFQFRFSSPAPGRKEVHWALGSRSDVFIELQSAMQTRARQRKKRMRHEAGVVEKFVVHSRSNPQIRAIVAVRAAQSGPRRVDDAVVRKIVSMYQQGKSYAQIAIKLKLVKKGETPTQAGKRLRRLVNIRKSPKQLHR